MFPYMHKLLLIALALEVKAGCGNSAYLNSLVDLYKMMNNNLGESNFLDIHEMKSVLS